jgi:hypothetical protein
MLRRLHALRAPALVLAGNVILVALFFAPLLAQLDTAILADDIFIRPGHSDPSSSSGATGGYRRRSRSASPRSIAPGSCPLTAPICACTRTTARSSSSCRATSCETDSRSSGESEHGAILTNRAPLSEAADRALIDGLLRHYPRELLRQMLAAAEEAARSADSDHAPHEIQVRARVSRGRVASWSVPRWRGGNGSRENNRAWSARTRLAASLVARACHKGGASAAPRRRPSPFPCVIQSKE